MPLELSHAHPAPGPTVQCVERTQSLHFYQDPGEACAAGSGIRIWIGRLGRTSSPSQFSSLPRTKLVISQNKIGSYEQVGALLLTLVAEGSRWLSAHS